MEATIALIEASHAGQALLILPSRGGDRFWIDDRGRL
jgi:hypothetical protein